MPGCPIGVAAEGVAEGRGPDAQGPVLAQGHYQSLFRSSTFLSYRTYRSSFGSIVLQ